MAKIALITQAGREAMVAAAGDGFSRLQVTHVGVGTALFEPNGSETAESVAENEVVRVPIAGSVRIYQDDAGNPIAGWQILANIRANNLDVTIGSVYIYAGDILFAVMSDEFRSVFDLTGDSVFSISVAVQLNIECSDAVQIVIDENAAPTLALISKYIQIVLDLRDLFVKHHHVINEVDGLPEALESKSPKDHNHDTTYSKLGHGHDINQVSGLPEALAGKSPTSHNHDTAYSKLDHLHQLEIIANKIRIKPSDAWETLPTSMGGTGAQGAAGAQGAKGDTGAQGAAGTNGINGTNGTNGAKGDTGAQGPPGDSSSSGGSWAEVGHLHDDRYVQIDTGSQQKGAVAVCKNTSASLAGGEAVSGAKLFPACVAMDGTVTAQSTSLPGTWRAKGLCLINCCSNFERIS